MRRHALLRGLHELLEPTTYFEIGVRDGMSLALSRARSVGVDPFFRITREVRCDVHLVSTTSDEFFAREHPFAHFDEPVVDLAFIDGMHLSEFVLRDFINTERFCSPGSVVVFDDVLPRSVEEAGRGREGRARHGAWAGDVFKALQSVRSLRPDLVVLEVDTFPTGVAVVLAPDSGNRILERAYDELVQDYVVQDPQALPGDVMRRSRAIRGEDLLGSGIWSAIRAARGRTGETGRESIRAACARAGLTADSRAGGPHA
ncbi:MAG: class I SAM-dependent methyltransferase [Nocardioides sp.]